MKPIKWFGFIADRSLDLQERLFRLLMIIGLCVLTAGIINGLIIGEEVDSILLLVAAFVFFVCVFYYAVCFRKIQQGAIIIAIVLIFAVLPLTFLTAGSIYGGAPIWLAFGMVYVCLVVVGKAKYILLAGSLVANALCYYIAYSYPSLVAGHTTETAYIDSMVSLFLVAALICGMILFQNRIYRWENALAKKQNQEIEELSRAQNRFFSSMSHEIRTPINTIIGLNEMILRENVSDEVTEDALNIQNASKMLLALINAFLDMSKIESGKMDIVPAAYDVGAMLSDIVNATWVLAKEKGLEFHVDVDRAVPAQLIGDEVRIRQILVNVLSNAVKYTDSGSVTLSIQSKGYESDYVQMSYSVTDTGIGIKQENIPYLFSAFKRINEKKNHYIEGTGLGLSIAKRLAELMGGDIAVNSVYMKGSTFVITLPQKAAGETKIGNFNLESRYAFNAREHYKQSFEAPNARILLVDDNATNLMVAEGLLRETRVQVDAVTDGDECLRRTLRNRYDVILMDHLMPGMDGIECLHAIRTQAGGMNQSTPVVILTANTGGDNLALYRREGFAGYLPKPVEARQLEEELLKHLPRELVSMTGIDDPVGIVESPILTHNKKLPVLISTESVCDLPKSLVEQYPIAVMPYRIVTGGGEFLDGIEVETDGLISYISKKGNYARAEEATVSDCEEFFAEQLTKAQYIVHITMASKISSGYHFALEAAGAFDNVIVIDSGSLSSAMGLMVLHAARHAAEGMSADLIAHEMEAIKARVKTSFIVDSTKYLMRSGQIPYGVDAVCRTLMLHPVLVVKKGGMKVGAIRVGARDYVWRKYIHSSLNVRGEIDTEILFITYTGLTKEELEEIKMQVQKKVAFQNIIFQKASPAISTNCGPGSFGLIFAKK